MISLGAIKVYKNANPYVKALHSLALRSYIYFFVCLFVLAFSARFSVIISCCWAYLSPAPYPSSSIQVLLNGLRNQITKLQRIVIQKVTVKSLRDSPGSRERNVSAWPIWHLFYMPRCPFNFFSLFLAIFQRQDS